MLEKITYVLFITALTVVTILLAFGIINENNAIFSLLCLLVAFATTVAFTVSTTREKINQLIERTKTIEEQTSPFEIKLIKESNLLDFWDSCNDYIHVFNAPWSLAEDKLIKTLTDHIKRKKIKFRVIYFEGVGEDETKFSQKRQKRIKSCLNKLASELGKNIPVKDYFEIKKVENEPLPSSTFFLSTIDKKPISILYIYPFIREEIPEFAVEIIDSQVVSHVRSEFDIWWSKATQINVEKFMEGKNESNDPYPNPKPTQ